MFSEEENNDADFNILALFILWEKIKGRDSFYSPWFCTTEENYSMYEWTSKELDRLDQPSIKDYALEFQDDMDSEWYEFKAVLKKYPEFFPQESYNRKLYIWCF